MRLKEQNHCCYQSTLLINLDSILTVRSKTAEYNSNTAEAFTDQNDFTKTELTVEAVPYNSK
ncbi:hypothetical protein HYC85_031041 [Camellia sinensis]|uniref:Uncharacterized protein n=1 Tax=Camellia sinensis TaxID=4442 RepID=A0A7J7FRA2_CAMSI|nr:hypothetical protein HYC85_031041 [Camellia sinensis]